MKNVLIGIILLLSFCTTKGDSTSTLLGERFEYECQNTPNNSRFTCIIITDKNSGEKYMYVARYNFGAGLIKLEKDSL